MQNSKFELFMGCLGNGTTLCNKSVIENGDYKTIGHISNAGNIKLYVKPDYIPAADMDRIKNIAAKDRAKFVSNLELEIKCRPSVMYEKMLDALSWTEYKDFSDRHKNDLFPEKLKAIVSLYLERS